MENRSFPVLLLHGFTSSLDCVKAPAEKLKNLGFDVKTPVLAGHGTVYKDLVGVKSEDWFNDAYEELKSLYEQYNTKVVVVGLSMGGAVALDLAIKHSDMVQAVVGVAPALDFKDPLARFSGFMSKFIKFWPAPNAFRDKKLKKEKNTNYPKFPVATFYELYKYGQKISNELEKLTVPVLLLHSMKDQIIPVEVSRKIIEKSSSEEKQIILFSKSGHEMFLDLEADKVTDEVCNFILNLDKKLKKTEK